MGTGVAYNPFQAHCVVNQTSQRLVSRMALAELRYRFHRLRQGLHPEGHHTGQLVNVGVGYGHGAACVPQRRLGPQCTEGDDLRHVVTPVLVHHVPQHLVPPVILEVHVNVRHLLPLDVQETLKHQGVRQWVYIGYAGDV